MVKVCLDQFPKGSYSGQQTPGLYMDGILRDNIDVLAKNIVRDMTFIGLGCSSTLGIRTGKSTLFQQIGTYYTHKINEMHGLNLTFDMKNIVFRSKDLIERAQQLPKYSVLILDEGDDLTAHYLSKTAFELRRFFRKCGQLNLFFLLILPDFFELPKGYAVAKTTFLINVKFENEFERGYFQFFNFKEKKKLHILGKKMSDYGVVKPSFTGRFPGVYTLNEKEYKKAKYDDFISEDIPERKTDAQIRKVAMVEVFNKVRKNLPDMALKDVAKLFEVTARTAQRYTKGNDSDKETINANILTIREDT